MTQASSLSALLKRQHWKGLLADIGLVVLVSAPLAAPFLAATASPLLQQAADLIYAVGQRMSPQPELGLPLAPPYLMAVCMRSYGTIIGLGIMRLLHGKTQGQGRYWLDQYGIWGFVIAFILFLSYPFELAMQGFDSWGVNPWKMTLFGLIAGIGIGAYLMPIFYESRYKRN